MILGSSERFKKVYGRLPPDVQHRVDKAIHLLVSDPKHPSLHNKKIQGAEGIWEVRVTQKYRMTYEKISGGVFLRHVGTHDILSQP